MRSASIEPATTGAPGAGSDASPYERPSPRVSGAERATAARSSDRTSRPGTEIPPHPASLASRRPSIASQRYRMRKDKTFLFQDKAKQPRLETADWAPAPRFRRRQVANPRRPEAETII